MLLIIDVEFVVGLICLPENFSDISSCFDGNPAIGFSILGGKLGLWATTGLPTPWNLLDSLSSISAPVGPNCHGALAFKSLTQAS
jgi:hypothetical protein